MSKVKISYDTATQSLSVSVDGTALDNVRSVNIYMPEEVTEYNTPGIDITQVDSGEENGLRKVVRLCATKENPNLSEGNYLGFPTIDPDKRLQEALNKLFEKPTELFKDDEVQKPPVVKSV